MIDSTTKRAFAQICLRLKRDVNYLQELNKTGFLKILRIEINPETIISINEATNNWILKTKDVFYEDWNPDVLELTTFMAQFTEKELLEAIQLFEENSDAVLQNVPAIGLTNKFNKITNLLKIEDNSGVEIFIETLLGDEITIIYDFEIKSLMCYTKMEPKKAILDENTISRILQNTSYYDLLLSLNNCYSELTITE